MENMKQMSTVTAQYHFVFQRRRQGWTIAALAFLHLALFWAVTRPVQESVEHDQRVWIQLLQARQLATVQDPPASKASSAPANPSRSPEKSATRPLDTAEPAPASPPPGVQDDALPAEAAPAAPRAGTLTLAEQALQAAGAIDRQLRAEHPQEFVAPPDTPQTRLAKGFAEAHAAVKPKWHEAARIELWSAPNDPKRIYRVITATGEYCIYLPDKGNMTLNLSARSGYAGFGEGTAAPCPIRF